MTKTIVLVCCAFITLASCSDNDGLPQQADPDFVPKNNSARFSKANSPLVFIDEGHNNFHTTSGRFKPFTDVLLSNGYTVQASTKILTVGYLKDADILVIANALDAGRHDWAPPFKDAFTNEEVLAIKSWVFQGGSLMLIADHMPFPRAIETLAEAFGFTFSNGHVDQFTFRTDDGSLPQHIIIGKVVNSLPATNLEFSINELRNSSHYVSSITQVKSFGGSAFQIPAKAEPLLTLGSNTYSLVPEIPFQVNANTPRLPMENWHQGATLKMGKGRIAVFAEAMMFTSQIYTPTGKKYGLVSRGAEQNEQFLLNIMKWLSEDN